MPELTALTLDEFPKARLEFGYGVTCLVVPEGDCDLPPVDG
jgi:hypothetical protein